MKRLTLVRHGQAESKSPQGSDFDRRLTQQGQTEARELGRRLQPQWIPDLLITSSAQRARQTAQILAGEIQLPAHHGEENQRLYLAASLTILELVQSVAEPVTHLMIVGHNPGISELARALAPAAKLAELGTAEAYAMTFNIASWSDLDYGQVGEVFSIPAR